MTIDLRSKPTLPDRRQKKMLEAMFSAKVQATMCLRKTRPVIALEEKAASMFGKEAGCIVLQEL